MHPINLIREETTSTLYAVIIKLIPFRSGSKFRAGKFCKRMQRQAVDHKNGYVAQAKYRNVQYFEGHILFLISRYGAQR